MQKKAFTLIELIVAITITAIMAIWINQISITKISDAQKVGIFLNQVRSNIETTINNSLTGKAIIWMNVPKYWKITINNSYNWTWFWTWNLIIKFWSWTFQTSTWLTIKTKKFYSISNIKCINLKWDSTSNINSWTLNIENWNIININWCPYNQKILKFDLKYKNFKKIISINSINNIINSK